MHPVGADDVSRRDDLRRAVLSDHSGCAAGEFVNHVAQPDPAKNAAAQLLESLFEPDLSLLLRYQQQERIRTGDVLVGQPEQMAITVDGCEAAALQAILDQAIGQTDPVEVLKGPRLHRGRFGTWSHSGLRIDDDVVDAQLGEGDAQGQACGAAADDQHVGVSWWAVGHRGPPVK